MTPAMTDRPGEQPGPVPDADQHHLLLHAPGQHGDDLAQLGGHPEVLRLAWESARQTRRAPDQPTRGSLRLLPANMVLSTRYRWRTCPDRRSAALSACASDA